MISKLLSCAAAVTIAAGMAALAPTAAAVADSVAPHTASALAPCGFASGFLNDGSGQGSAASITPGTTPSPGEAFTQRNDSDAWEMCLHTDGTLQPISAPGWCAADNSNVVRLRPCNLNSDQTWSVVATSGGSFHLQSFYGGYLCAFGGVDTLDTVAALSGCSSYHDTWKFIAG